MDFEYDEAKSATNKQKHGISFTEAAEIWDDTRRIEIPARTDDEPRWLVIGTIGAKHWAAVVTYRAGRVRIISVRRARAEEVKVYEG